YPSGGNGWEMGASMPMRMSAGDGRPPLGETGADRLRRQGGERGFGAAVQVHPVRLQPVVSGTGLRVVEGDTDVVAAVEPVDGCLRPLDPQRVAGEVGRRLARLGHRPRFDRLLVEPRRLVSLSPA